MGVTSSSESGVAHPSIGASGGVAAAPSPRLPSSFPLSASSPPVGSSAFGGSPFSRSVTAAGVAPVGVLAAPRAETTAVVKYTVWLGGMRRAWACCASGTTSK